MASALNDGRALQRLLDELGRLPSIGPKTAQRIAFHLLSTEKEEARRLAQAIIDVTDQVHFCPVCFNYATGDTCSICADETRDRSTICVVSEPRDVTAIERAGVYRGLYHVLGGVLSPLDGISPDQIAMLTQPSSRTDTPVADTPPFPHSPTRTHFAHFVKI